MAKSDATVVKTVKSQESPAEIHTFLKETNAVGEGVSDGGQNSGTTSLSHGTGGSPVEEVGRPELLMEAQQVEQGLRAGDSSELEKHIPSLVDMTEQTSHGENSDDIVAQVDEQKGEQTPTVGDITEMEPGTSSPEMEPGTSSPKMEPGTSSPKMEPGTSRSEMELATSRPEMEPGTSSPKMEPGTSRSEMELATSRPEMEPGTSSPKMEPGTSSPEMELGTSRPEMEPGTSSPKMEPGTSSPKMELGTSRPESEHDTPAPESEHDTPAPESEHDTPAPESEHDTPGPGDIKEQRSTEQPGSSSCSPVENTGCIGAQVEEVPSGLASTEQACPDESHTSYRQMVNNSDDEHQSSSEEDSSSEGGSEGAMKESSSEDEGSSNNKKRQGRKGAADAAADVAQTRSGFIKTKGEITPEDLPPIEELQITVDDSVNMLQVGTISGVVGMLVIVKAKADSPALHMDTILFLEEKKVFGQIFETFGQVASPMYSVRFNDSAHMERTGVEIGQPIYYAPAAPEYTQYVFLEQLRKLKGSDASWEHNNEPPDMCVDYSDDEKERFAKKKGSRSRESNLNEQEPGKPQTNKRRKNRTNQRGDLQDPANDTKSKGPKLSRMPQPGLAADDQMGRVQQHASDGLRTHHPGFRAARPPFQSQHQTWPPQAFRRSMESTPPSFVPPRPASSFGRFRPPFNAAPCGPAFRREAVRHGHGGGYSQGTNNTPALHSDSSSWRTPFGTPTTQMPRFPPNSGLQNAGHLSFRQPPPPPPWRPPVGCDREPAINFNSALFPGQFPHHPQGHPNASPQFTSFFNANSHPSMQTFASQSKQQAVRPPPPGLRQQPSSLPLLDGRLVQNEKQSAN